MLLSTFRPIKFNSNFIKPIWCLKIKHNLDQFAVPICQSFRHFWPIRSLQIASNHIIIVMTPYCTTPQHLLHMQEGVKLLSLKTFGESKCPGYLNCLWNYSQAHYTYGRWCTSKWTLGHNRKKNRGCITSHMISHFIIQYYPIFFISSRTRKLYF